MPDAVKYLLAALGVLAVAAFMGLAIAGSRTIDAGVVGPVLVVLGLIGFVAAAVWSRRGGGPGSRGDLAGRRVEHDRGAAGAHPASCRQNPLVSVASKMVAR